MVGNITVGIVVLLIVGGIIFRMPNRPSGY